MSANDITLRVAGFAGAALAVIAASDVAPPEVRLGSGALAAGCAYLVALLRPPGQSSAPDSPLTKEERKDALKELIREQTKTGAGKG